MDRVKHKLFEDNEEYSGTYVATPSFSDHTIVSSASTITQTLADAQAKGYNDPVIVKIPSKGVKLLF